MENNDKKKILDSSTDPEGFVARFEKKVRENLTKFLQDTEALDSHVPECPDVEEKWGDIARSYLPDGVREFKDYPVVSLGWMMLMGMAMSYYWDTDWTKYSGETEYYQKLRDKAGYDNFDDTVLHDLLGYEGEALEKISQLTSDCAARVYGLLSHEHVEPGTKVAMGCYIACLHQLYLAGMAMELNALGYHMTPWTGNPSLN